MDIAHVSDHECISCGECIEVCPTDAIQWKGPQILLPKNEIGEDKPEAKKQLKKKQFITRLIAAIALLAILIGTGVYHWNVSSSQVNIQLDADRGNQIGDLCYGYDLPIITKEAIQEETMDPTTLGRVTVINFWYTTCGPCVAELPYFDYVAQKYADQVTVVAVHGMFPTTAPAFIEKNYPNSPIVFLSDFIPEGDNTTELDRTGYYTMLGGVNNAYPRTVIVDKNGIITHIFPGAVHQEELENAVKEALEK